MAADQLIHSNWLFSSGCCWCGGMENVFLAAKVKIFLQEHPALYTIRKSTIYQLLFGFFFAFVSCDISVWKLSSARDSNAVTESGPQRLRRVLQPPEPAVARNFQLKTALYISEKSIMKTCIFFKHTDIKLTPTWPHHLFLLLCCVLLEHTLAEL